MPIVTEPVGWYTTQPTSLLYCAEPLFGPCDCPVERHKYHSIWLYEKGAHALVLFQTPEHENRKNDTDEEAHVDSGRRESMNLVRKGQKSRQSKFPRPKCRNNTQVLSSIMKSTNQYYDGLKYP